MVLAATLLAHIGEVVTFYSADFLSSALDGVTHGGVVRFADFFLQNNVQVVRVKLRRFDVARVLGIKRQAQVPVLGQKLVQFEVTRDIETGIVKTAALLYFLVDCTIPDGPEITGHGYVAKVGHLDVHAGNTCYPTPLVEAS